MYDFLFSDANIQGYTLLHGSEPAARQAIQDYWDKFCENPRVMGVCVLFFTAMSLYSSPSAQTTAWIGQWRCPDPSIIPWLLRPDMGRGSWALQRISLRLRRPSDVTSYESSSNLEDFQHTRRPCVCRHRTVVPEWLGSHIDGGSSRFKSTSDPSGWGEVHAARRHTITSGVSLWKGSHLPNSNSAIYSPRSWSSLCWARYVFFILFYCKLGRLTKFCSHWVNRNLPAMQRRILFQIIVSSPWSELLTMCIFPLFYAVVSNEYFLM